MNEATRYERKLMPLSRFTSTWTKCLGEEGRLRLLTAEENAATYTFNKHVIKHRFCPKCGIHPYGEGVDPKGDRMAAINIRCLDDIDLASVPVQDFDGRSM